MTNKQKIFKLLDEKGYATDSDVARTIGKEPNWSTVEEYKAEWSRLNRDRNFFADKKIYSIEKYRRNIFATTEQGMYRISKAYFDELKQNATRDYRKPNSEIERYMFIRIEPVDK